MSAKKFGLIIPKKGDKLKKQANPFFNDESDEDEKERKRPKIPQKKIELKSKIKQETLEDPSIYEYDSIYDEMKAKEAESIAPKEKKNSRYIDTLLKAADKRKKEYERRVDKKIQVEREKEGDLYKDKEAFVTSSYKKKLQEKEEEEERERRENMLNDMMDITKQKDLSGFYRHFLKQTVGEEKIPVFGEKYIKKEVTTSSNENSPKRSSENVKDIKKFDYASIDQDSDGIEIDSESDDKQSYTSEDKSNKKISVTDNTSQRFIDNKEDNRRSKTNEYKLSKDKYSQQRKKCKTQHGKTSNTSSSDSESSVMEDVILSKKNSYSSKKTSIHRTRHDSLSSDDKKVSKSDEQNESTKTDSRVKSNAYTKHTGVDRFTSPQKTRYNSSSDSEHSGMEDILQSKRSSHSNKKANVRHTRHDSLSSDDNKIKKSDEQNNQDEITLKVNNLKLNIYTKRTVGEIFISAQARYFQRMASKS